MILDHNVLQKNICVIVGEVQGEFKNARLGNEMNFFFTTFREYMNFKVFISSTKKHNFSPKIISHRILKYQNSKTDSRTQRTPQLGILVIYDLFHTCS